jgi:hypothetical protein
MRGNVITISRRTEREDDRLLAERRVATQLAFQRASISCFDNRPDPTTMLLQRKVVPMKRSGLAFVVTLCLGTLVRGADDYTLGPDSMPHDGVPKGRVEGPFVWKSEIFRDTVRQYWVDLARLPEVTHLSPTLDHRSPIRA